MVWDLHSNTIILRRADRPPCLRPLFWGHPTGFLSVEPIVIAVAAVPNTQCGKDALG